MKTSKLSVAVVATCALMCCGMAEAQDFDLSQQRKEVQQFRPVNGEKVDHRGIVVNPIPQAMDIATGEFLEMSGAWNIVDEKGVCDGMGRIFGSAPGAKLVIDYDEGKAASAGVKAVEGAYMLVIDKNGISILGYDECGAFYGVQTLRQILACEATKGGKIPCMTVNDYPDLPMRGVVEGFYGTPWSHEVRLSLIDFFGRFKMNTYVYGPKDDPYHRSPNWRDPYPTDEAARIVELVKACGRNHVNFVWAIHPGQDIKWNEEDYGNLFRKFDMMYKMGVRQFAIFFDDISGDGTSPSKQTELLNRLTDEFVKVRGDVAPLIMCPTDYNKSWANPTPKGSLAYFGNNLNPDIKVFWTGDVVCSDLTAGTLDWVNSRIKRPALFWWNYPVTDYVRNMVLQGPVYGLDTSLTADDVSGILSNPMEHGEASKLALYGVADYAWNVSAYNPIDNWERGLRELAPCAAEAYRTFAIHSCDTETGYRRDESWETRVFDLDEWNAADAQALTAEFERIEQVPRLMEEGCDNALLLAELRPWLVEFGKLGTRGKRTVALMDLYHNGNDDAELWSKYVENLMTAKDVGDYNAHKSGTMKLQPFYEKVMDDIAFRFLEKLSGEVPCSYRGLSSFPNSSTMQPQLMLDGDTATYYTSALPQRKESWVAVDLRSVRDVHSVDILQGRNSVDDVDFFDHAALEYSADGKTWLPLIPDIDRQYVITWTGSPVKARYVRLKRLDSKRTNYVAVRSFEVNAPTVETIGFDLHVAGDEQAAMRAFDKNASTAYACDGAAMTIGIPAGVKGYHLLMGSPEDNVEVAMLSADGSILEKMVSVQALTTCPVPDGAVSMRISGATEIFEIVPIK